MDIVYLDFKLTELSLFPSDIIQTLKTLKQGPIFVKFHTIPPEEDRETRNIYQDVSLIQTGYISGNHQLNIESTKKFDFICFNESWINYQRSSGAIVVKCHEDRLYTTGLKCLLRTNNYAIVTKEGMQEGHYDDELLKFLFQLEPENFQ